MTITTRRMTKTTTRMTITTTRMTITTRRMTITTTRMTITTTTTTTALRKKMKMLSWHGVCLHDGSARTLRRPKTRRPVETRGQRKAKALRWIRLYGQRSGSGSAARFTSLNNCKARASSARRFELVVWNVQGLSLRGLWKRRAWAWA